VNIYRTVRFVEER